MPRKLKIDRAVYLVDDQHKTYRFLHRNPAWAALSHAENKANKRVIDGYTRIFLDRHTQTYHWAAHP